MTRALSNKCRRRASLISTHSTESVSSKLMLWFTVSASSTFACQHHTVAKGVFFHNLLTKEIEGRQTHAIHSRQNLPTCVRRAANIPGARLGCRCKAPNRSRAALCRGSSSALARPSCRTRPRTPRMRTPTSRACPPPHSALQHRSRFPPTWPRCTRSPTATTPLSPTRSERRQGVPDVAGEHRSRLRLQRVERDARMLSKLSGNGARRKRCAMAATMPLQMASSRDGSERWELRAWISLRTFMLEWKHPQMSLNTPSRKGTEKFVGSDRRAARRGLGGKTRHRYNRVAEHTKHTEHAHAKN